MADYSGGPSYHEMTHDKKCKDGSTSAAYDESLRKTYVTSNPSPTGYPEPDGRFLEEERVVLRPPHYTWLKEKCGIEVWDITQWLPGNLAAVVKYVLRAGLKDAAVQDLKKARQYLDHEIERLS